MTNTEDVTRLKQLLVGKRILAIEASDAPWTLFTVKTDVGSVAIHAEAQSFWISEYPDSCVYRNVDDLIAAYEAHMNSLRGVCYPTWVRDDTHFTITLADKKFSLLLNDLPLHQRAILMDPDGAKLFVDGVTMGPFFNTIWDPEKNYETDGRFRWTLED